MRVNFRRVRIARKMPLRISRGLAGETENLFVEVEHEGTTGLGEMAPFGYGREQTAEVAEAGLRAVEGLLSKRTPWEVRDIESELVGADIISGARCAVDTACWDWVSKKAGLPLHRLFGLSAEQPPTSVTIGILEAEEAKDRAEWLAATYPDCSVKLKLGGDGGTEADKERFRAVRAVLPGVPIRVDANGGWSPVAARAMLGWLADEGAEYVEQPIHHDLDEELEYVVAGRRIDVFLDESIQDSKDVARFANRCDGVNIKLMKTGGITEGIRCVNVARAVGLKTMIGCMSESSVGIAAGASIGSLFDFIDLDSHLNMDPDPAVGVSMRRGSLVPAEVPGLGVHMK